jgi:hypothetical protein
VFRFSSGSLFRRKQHINVVDRAGANGDGGSQSCATEEKGMNAER